MRLTTVRASLVGVWVSAVFLLAVGCGQVGTPTEPANGADTPPPSGKQVDDHSGWWCPEHGIPEDECSMCSAKVAKECKVNGDWCAEHDRAKSQCFLCDPSLKEKFAAKYRAKYGTEPPPIGEEAEKE